MALYACPPFSVERERRDTRDIEPVAVFRFLSEDWSPWIALLRMRERWPELRFRLIPSYLQAVWNDSPARTSGLGVHLGSHEPKQR